MKKKLITIVLLMVLLLSLCACADKLTVEEEYALLKSNELTVNSIKASYIIDTYNLGEVLAYADYVFVGEVISYKKTIRDSELPKTVYAVKVIETLKGALENNIEIHKTGGLSKNNKSKIIMQDDILPLVGNRYVFIASANSSTDLDIFGNNSNFIIDDGAFSNNAKYKTIVEELSKSSPLVRERYKSKYDRG